MQFVQSFEDFIRNISNVELSVTAILLTAFIFLFLHGQRNHKVLAQLSIVFGFIPVLIHEIGHAMLTSLTRGYVSNIYMVLTPRGQLKSGAQGVATTAPRNWLSNVLMAFAGYAFPPLVFITGIILAVHGYGILFTVLLVIFGLYYFWHTSQKWLPFLGLVLLIYSGIDMVAAFSDMTRQMINIGYSVILGLLLGEIIQSISITAKVNFASQDEWDGTALRKLTFIPATIWWLAWTVLSVWSLWHAYNLIMLYVI